MELYSSIVRFFQGGGHWMLPIAIVLVLGLAIAAERFIYLWNVGRRNRALWSEITPFLQRGDFRSAVQVTSKSDSAIGQILNYGLARVASARRRDDIEKAMEESLTAFGLLTAVPLLFIHAWLQSRTTALIDSLEMASVKFLNSITERRPDAPAAA